MARPSRPLLAHPAFQRTADDRVVAGVAGGLARTLGVDVVVVRVAFVILAFCSGVGVLAYGLALLVSEPARGDAAVREPSERYTLGVACIALSVLTMLFSSGLLWFPELIVPVALVLLGGAIVWSRSDDDERSRFAREPFSAFFLGRLAAVRIVLGFTILVAGFVFFGVENAELTSLRASFITVLATVIGIALLASPVLNRLYRQLGQERRSRIRMEERAEMSAHLHDSVLQTLAMIQRTEASPDVVALARRQERELRAWMLGSPQREQSTLDAAVMATVERLEVEHLVSIEPVVVGDLALTESVRTYVAALGEALTNAARHSGVRNISLFVEVEQDALVAYVRDQGRGFVRGAVPEDRRGISESIEGRLRRIGGSANVTSTPGEGTEVELRLAKEHWS